VHQVVVVGRREGGGERERPRRRAEVVVVVVVQGERDGRVHCCVLRRVEEVTRGTSGWLRLFCSFSTGKDRDGAVDEADTHTAPPPGDGEVRVELDGRRGRRRLGGPRQAHLRVVVATGGKRNAVGWFSWAFERA
jgi:hypothetical protein